MSNERKLQIEQNIIQIRQQAALSTGNIVKAISQKDTQIETLMNEIQQLYTMIDDKDKTIAELTAQLESSKEQEKTKKSNAKI